MFVRFFSSFFRRGARGVVLVSFSAFFFWPFSFAFLRRAFLFFPSFCLRVIRLARLFFCGRYCSPPFVAFSVFYVVPAGFYILSPVSGLCCLSIGLLPHVFFACLEVLLCLSFTFLTVFSPVRFVVVLLFSSGASFLQLFPFDCLLFLAFCLASLGAFRLSLVLVPAFFVACCLLFFVDFFCFSSFSFVHLFTASALCFFPSYAFCRSFGLIMNPHAPVPFIIWHQRLWSLLLPCLRSCARPSPFAGLPFFPLSTPLYLALHSFL